MSDSFHENTSRADFVCNEIVKIWVSKDFLNKDSKFSFNLYKEDKEILNFSFNQKYGLKIK